jgi:cytochrome c
MKKVFFIASLALVGFSCSSGGGESEEAPATNDAATEQTEAKEEVSDNSEPPAEINALLQQHTCLTCHKVEERLVGPPYKQVALRNYTNEEIVELIYEPKPENWPDYPPMAALPNVPEEDALKIAAWINSLNPRNN